MIFIEIYLQIRNIDDFSNKKQAKKQIQIVFCRQKRKSLV